MLGSLEISNHFGSVALNRWEKLVMGEKRGDA